MKFKASIKQCIKKNLYRLFPHKIIPNRVLFEGIGPYDNGYSLFRYARVNAKHLECYFLVPWQNRKQMPKECKKNLVYTYNSGLAWWRAFFAVFSHPASAFKTMRLRSTFAYEFSSYGSALSWNRGTKKIYVYHGIGLKGAMEYFKSVYNAFDKATVPSAFVKSNYVKYYSEKEDKFDILPSCRGSELKFDDKTNRAFRDLVHAGSNKILLVMVTFRRNPDNTFDEKAILPLQLDFNRLNAILVNAGYTMVVKLHHALNNADLSIFPNCSNIVFLKNKDIQKLGLTPTSTMPYCDALISDYSSCSTDYLLLDRPIGYLIPDFESYKTEINGGFIFDDPLSLMAGDKFTNQEGLEKFIEALGDGRDTHKEERAKVNKLLNGDWPKDVCPEKAVLDFYCGQQALK